MDRLRILSDMATGLLEGRYGEREMLPALFELMLAERNIDPTFEYVLTGLGEGPPARHSEELEEPAGECCAGLDPQQRICAAAASAGVPLHIADVRNSPDPRANGLRAIGVTAFASEPLLAGGQVTGTLSFVSRMRRSFDEEDLGFFRLIARNVALARERSLHGSPCGISGRELRHRVRNLLSSVQAVASISARSAESMESFIRSLSDRIVALGCVQELIGRGGDRFDLRQLFQLQLQDAGAGGAVRIDGPGIEVPAAVAVPLGMAVHELKANAMRFGSLSSPGGVLLLRWDVEQEADGRRVRIDWRERGGPPASEPLRNGFGTQLLDGLLGSRFKVQRTFAPEGLSATIEIMLQDS